MKMTSSLRFLFGLIFLAPVAASALEAVLTDDSYTSSLIPAATHQTDANLYVRGGAAGGICRAWFKFRLGAVLPANKTSDQITVATLKVYIPTVTTASNASVMSATPTPPATSGNMDELYVCDSNLTTTGPLYSTQAISSPGRYYYFDVTALVQGWLDGSITNNGLAIVAGDVSTSQASSSVNFQVESKESTTTSHPASLHLVFVPRIAPKGDVSMGGFTNGPQP